MDDQPRSMLTALANAARRARRRIPRAEIAALAGVSVKTIARFERAEGWPADPERLVNAYAECACLHPRELWQAAVNTWGNGHH